MSNDLRITVLVENSVHRAGLGAEHGLAFHVRFRGRDLLFDTGQTDLVARNAANLGISIANIAAVVLSHGHYDHTGGLPAVLAAAPRAGIFAHPAVSTPKFSRPPDGPARAIGMNEPATRALANPPGGRSDTRGWTPVADGIFVTGEIPRASAFEDTGGPFFLDATATRPDPILDDQALVVDLGGSVVVLLGCAHSGVVNTLDHVARNTGGKPVRAVIGGFHLGAATGERVAQTVARLRQMPVECLMPLHCTGWAATVRLWQEFPEAFRPGGVGTIIEFRPD